MHLLQSMQYYKALCPLYFPGTVNKVRYFLNVYMDIVNSTLYYNGLDWSAMKNIIQVEDIKINETENRKRKQKASKNEVIYPVIPIINDVIEIYSKIKLLNSLYYEYLSQFRKVHFPLFYRDSNRKPLHQASTIQTGGPPRSLQIQYKACKLCDKSYFSTSPKYSHISFHLLPR